MAEDSKALDDALNPADGVQLRQYQVGAISARELARRVLVRLGIEVPETLKGDRLDAPDGTAETATVSTATAVPAHKVRFTSSMGEDTAMIARGELDIAGWLSRAENKYRRD